MTMNKDSIKNLAVFYSAYIDYARAGDLDKTSLYASLVKQEQEKLDVVLVPTEELDSYIRRTA